MGKSLVLVFVGNDWAFSSCFFPSPNGWDYRKCLCTCKDAQSCFSLPIWCNPGGQSKHIGSPPLSRASVSAVVVLMGPGGPWGWLCSQELGSGSCHCRVKSATGEQRSWNLRKNPQWCWRLLGSAVFQYPHLRGERKFPFPSSLCLPTTHLVLNTFFRPDFVQTQCCSASIKRQFSTQRIKSSC